MVLCTTRLVPSKRERLEFSMAGRKKSLVEEAYRIDRTSETRQRRQAILQASEESILTQESRSSYQRHHILGV